MGINLLPPSERLSGQELAMSRRLRNWSWSAVALYSVVVLGVFGYWSYWDLRVRIAQGELAKLGVSLDEKRKIEGTYLILRNKLETVAKLVGNRQSAAIGWTKVEGLLSADVVVKSLSVSQDGVVSVSAEASDAVTLENLEGRLLAQKEFGGATLANLTRIPKGYSFSISFSPFRK